MKKLINMKWILGFSLSLALVFTSCDKENVSIADSSENVAAFKSLVIDGVEVVTCGDAIYTFWAGQTDSVGYVKVSNDAENIYVEVFSTNGFQNVDENIKMWLGTDLLLLPRSQGGDGAPINGQFPYKETVAGNSHTFSIALQDIPGYDATVCGEQALFVVVHGDVISSDENGGSAETAYSGDITGDGNRWWYYSAYIPQCCDNSDPDPEYSLETAFAYGSYVFVTELYGKRAGSNNPDGLEYLNLTRNRWGWANSLSEGSYEFNIWAGAGLNNTDNGVLVGVANVDVTASGVDIIYLMNPEYKIEEVHAYVSDVPPTTIAPGQYGHTEYFDPMTGVASYSFDVKDTDGDGVWLILHAVVAIPIQ